MKILIFQQFSIFRHKLGKFSVIWANLRCNDYEICDYKPLKLQDIHFLINKLDIYYLNSIYISYKVISYLNLIDNKLNSYLKSQFLVIRFKMKWKIILTLNILHNQSCYFPYLVLNTHIGVLIYHLLVFQYFLYHYY